MPATELDRASPDALLAAARKEGQGRLRIYLGAAPGVGKTFAMLTAAQAARWEGREVVVGLIETHGRQETAALLGDLEVLPRRPSAYRNRIEQEFDLDAALARRPDLLLVDEYAHTNIPGSRHPKRWQDIQELLAAGIDVWTTLNVQHLESLNDVVQQITRVRVRETVPDLAFDETDEVVLVDLPPNELLKRLAEGKVYVRDNAARALANFFKPQNLSALRELALRRAAHRVDSDLVERMQAQAISGPWAAGERILACVGPDPQSMGVVRTAKRLADLMDAPWITVTVERPGYKLSDAAQRQVVETLRLAETLGAETKTLVGSDIPSELLRLARAENATQIVIGRPHAGPLRELLRRSLPHELVRQAGDFAIHVVGRGEEPRPSVIRRWTATPLPRWPALGWATLAVACAALVAEGLSLITPFPNISSVFLLAVLVAALRLGIGPAIYASVFSFLAHNFLFIEPLYTFTIAQPYELLALSIFLAVAVLTSAAAGQVRNQAQASAERMRATRRLYEFTRRLSGLATTDQVAEGIAGEIHASIGRPAIVLLTEDREFVVKAAWPPEDALDATAMTAARWALSHDEPAGNNTGTLPTIPWFFIPLRSPRGPIGVIGIGVVGDVLLDAETRSLLDTLAEQAGAALDRAALAHESEAARTAVETERVRNTLLSSISHDFRTPLASILGSATSLIDYGDKIDRTTREDLLRHIKDESEHLDDMVRNLLAIGRIEAGVLELRQDWVDLREIVDRVIAAARARGVGKKFVTMWPGDMPLVMADPILTEQAIANVVGNTLLHTAAEASVTIDAVVEPEALALRITDDGPGIPAEVLPRVFEKFIRGSEKAGSRADGGEGAGLGLAIVKGVMEAHGGSAAAESPVTNGHGTRIMLRFPLAGKAT